MVQVKKPSVRDAILRSAAALFTARGYHRTTLAAIAKSAGVGVGNIYSYFPSKLHLLYRIYRPWLTQRIAELEAQIEATPAPRERLRRCLLGIWRDIPATNTGLANSLMEALASIDPEAGKPDDLLRWTERRLTELLYRALPARRRRLLGQDLLAHLLLMAYDGFVINRRLGDTRDMEALAETVCDMILGVARRPAHRRRTRRAPAHASKSRKTA